MAHPLQSVHSQAPQDEDDGDDQWVECETSKGVPYFHNQRTGQSTWDPPAGVHSDRASRYAPLPSGFKGRGKIRSRVSGVKGFLAGTYRDRRDVFDFLLKLAVVVAIVVLIQIEQSRLNEAGRRRWPLICRCGCKA